MFYYFFFILVEQSLSSAQPVLKLVLKFSDWYLGQIDFPLYCSSPTNLKEVGAPQKMHFSMVIE